MAVLTSVVDVNSGQTGWSNVQVIDALETVFANLGWHSNATDTTGQTGVPCWCRSPGETSSTGSPSMSNGEDAQFYSYDNWRQAGGPEVSYNNVQTVTRNFDVVSNGNTSYYMMEKWYPSAINTANDTVTIIWNKSDPNPNHSTSDIVQTGDKLRWAPGGSNTDWNIGGLTLDTDYYAIRISETEIKIAASNADALAGNAISLTSVPTAWNYYFRRPQDSSTENRQIDVYIGDTLFFNVDAEDFWLWDNTVDPNYNVDSILQSGNQHSTSYRDFPTGLGDLNPGIQWETGGWEQSEDEVYDPTREVTGVGFTGLFSYAYGHKTNQTMKSNIRLLPRFSNEGTIFYPYWKYEVPASGGRSALKLRVSRIPVSTSYDGQIGGVTIHSFGTGWGANESFTIPGEMIGGLATTNDLNFGVNTSGDTTAGDGIASIDTTDIGGTSNFFQRSSHADFINYAVLRLENEDPSLNKKFGVTYWAFGFNTENYEMFIKSGIGWTFLNKKGRNYTGSSEKWQWGTFQGETGLDVQPQPYLYLDTNYDTEIDYATSSTPNGWPLSIRTYKAQSPQDDNFAIIQFTQLVNGNNVPRGQFTIHKGNTFGVGVSDLDYTWLGSLTEYAHSSSTEEIDFTWRVPGYHQSGNAAHEEPVGTYSLARELSYGWTRNDQWSSSDYRFRWSSNIRTDSTTTSEAIIYYRDSAFDKLSESFVSTWNSRHYKRKHQLERAVDSSCDYYKPIKGIPIQNLFVPVPYYLPDDFVLIQVAITPASTAFYPGDTVEVSASEKYVVIVPGYNTYSEGLDGIASGTSKAMLLCAKIP